MSSLTPAWMRTGTETGEGGEGNNEGNNNSEEGLNNYG